MGEAQLPNLIEISRLREEMGQPRRPWTNLSLHHGSPELEAPYSREEERQRLSDLYHRLHARLHNTSRPLRLIYHVAEKETLLAWVSWAGL